MKLLVAAFLGIVTLSASPALASVACIQEFLGGTAFDAGPADGAWGKRTAAALTDFFAQVGETVEGGLGKDNVVAICTFLTGPRHDELLEKASFRVYPVAIDPSQIDSRSTKTIFDFAKFEIASVSTPDCRFDIHRRNKKTLAVENEAMVEGVVSIVRGTLIFGEHQWHSGGMADESYLRDEANLRVLSTGQIVGMTPYFSLIVGSGDPPEPPIYVTFSKAFTSKGQFPSGTTEFDAGGSNEDGLFTLTCGEDGADNPGGFDFSSFEIASDTSFKDCRFSITRRFDDWPADKRSEVLADGRLNIKNGDLIFGDNQWHTGGMADETYLQNKAALKLTTSGQIVGVAPFFHMVVNDDHPDPVPPLEVTLSASYKSVGTFPNGVSMFAVPGEDQSGALTLGLCHPAT